MILACDHGAVVLWMSKEPKTLLLGCKRSKTAGAASFSREASRQYSGDCGTALKGPPQNNFLVIDSGEVLVDDSAVLPGHFSVQSRCPRPPVLRGVNCNFGVWGICSDQSRRTVAERNHSRGPVHFMQLNKWKWTDPLWVVPQRPFCRCLFAWRREATPTVLVLLQAQKNSLLLLLATQKKALTREITTYA